MDYKVQPATSLQGTLQLPADKSISHRAAMFAALHEGTSVITNFSEAADPHSTLDCLRRLGVEIEEQSGHTIKVEGVGRDGMKTPSTDLDCGNSGTTMRLLSGIITGSGLSARLTGDESLSNRTMRRIIEPLRRMGAHIDAREDDFAPLSISRSAALKPLHFPLPIASAQLKSCVLLAGLFGEKPTEVVETLPSRDHTERLLSLSIVKEGEKKIIRSSRQDPVPQQSYRVPNDFSAAAFWLVAGAIHPDASIRLPKVGLNPSRTGALEILKQMGTDIEITNNHNAGAEPVADIRVKSSRLRPVTITEEIVPNCIDEIPILAIAMLFADGVSKVSGAEELRHKETDRLHALAEMLSAAGAEFEEYADGLKIAGDPDFIPDGAAFKSFHDHRIAMAAAVMGLMGEEPSTVLDGDSTAISYPNFWTDLSMLTN
ncbi:3-phosphoshikimate 1-carboxyvinyltransferase [Fodinibius sediminis]|uniref:3-phosphoshikimate 1-carboxyvinyltransferase n=1 Tax=Fodinibius sediminis TaxID=1214077 RepID=A0A521D1B8_9BACT|nr:3-phosphoshikimate 1-carboxyvinyltransferase [Fodinibius sediminis]SMO65476.1 3-phosphoshikimate 1-carboxyvinyltransferase [Fodinibius sediminis]